MDGDTSITPDINATVTVPVAPEQAFDLFTVGLSEWWIPEYTWSGRALLERIGMELREGGLCYEVGPHGFRMDWGRVLIWEAPRRLVFTWQISPQRVPEPDPTRASEVEVRFLPADTGTQVELVHRHFQRHGDGSAAYRGGMSVGWEQLLGRFAERAGAAA